MPYMTYADLAVCISKMTPEQLNRNVTIKTMDAEFFMADLEITDDKCDVLDSGHPILASIA